MTNKSNGAGSIHLSIRVTEDLWLLMQKAMRDGMHKSFNEFVRTCIRAYIDETVDIAGSRRHFNNRMNGRMDRLEAMILWNSFLTQVVTARGMFTVMDGLMPEDAEAEPPTPDVQLDRAVEMGKKLLPRYLAEQVAITQELEMFRRQQAKVGTDTRKPPGK